MRALIALATVLMLSSATIAQVIDQTKTYGTEPDCGMGDGRGLTLDFATGIEGVEFHCDFFEVKSRTDSDWLLVEAICEAPGMRNPNLLSITQYDENSIEVVSLYDSAMFPATEDNPNPGTSIYQVCK